MNHGPLWNSNRVQTSWNVTAHAQKPHFVFRRNGRVHLNRRRRQFSPLLAAEVCASALIVGSNAWYTMFRRSEKGSGYPLHSLVSPSLPQAVRRRVPSHFNWSLPTHQQWITTHVTNKCTILYFTRPVFSQLHVSVLLSRHLRGVDTKIYLKHTAIK
jgi:hypothetical protein